MGPSAALHSAWHRLSRGARVGFLIAFLTLRTSSRHIVTVLLCGLTMRTPSDCSLAACTSAKVCTHMCIKSGDAHSVQVLLPRHLWSLQQLLVHAATLTDTLGVQRRQPAVVPLSSAFSTACTRPRPCHLRRPARVLLLHPQSWQPLRRRVCGPELPIFAASLHSPTSPRRHTVVSVYLYS
jgi:hypothetical protein